MTVLITALLPMPHAPDPKSTDLNRLLTRLMDLRNRIIGTPISIEAVPTAASRPTQDDHRQLRNAAVTQVNTIPIQQADFTVSFGTFDAFDASLGTLISVTATLTATAASSGMLTNASSDAQTFTFAINNQTFISGGPAPLTAAFGGSTPLTFSSLIVDYDLAAGATAPFPPTGSNGFAQSSVTSQNTFSNALHLAAFENGTFSVNLATVTGAAIGGCDRNIETIVTTEVGGTLAIAYTYNPRVVTP